MKKQLFNTILLTVLISMVETKVLAQDFAVENADGVNIYYNYINEGKDLEVARKKEGSYSGNVVIPEEVTFMNRTRKVTSIGEYAFYFCSSLTSVIIPNNVTTIGRNAFMGCSSMNFVTIPNSVTSIEEFAFYGCYGLNSVTIGNSVTYIGSDAFAGCIDLTSITIPNSVTNIGGEAFSGCYKLTSVKIPNNVITIGESAFQDCSGLTSVTIGNSVTSIGSAAFCRCSGLTSITIPNSVTSLEGNAFDDCKNVTSVISLIENPFEIIGKSSNSRAFDLDIFNNVTLYVPIGTVDKYKATKGWKDFLFIEEGTGPDDDGGTSETKKCAMPTIGYQNGKLTFNSETDGASCQYTISDDDIKSGNSNEVQLSVTYHISVYATKTGYENSDVVTATLCWIDMEPKTEGITDGIANVRARAVLIQSSGNMLTVYGADEGSTISVFDIAGRPVGFAKVLSEATNISTSLRIGDLGVVKIGDNTVKVLMK